MLTISPELRALLDSKSVYLHPRYEFDGVDYTKYLNSIPTITRAIGEITAGALTAQGQNTEGTFLFLKQDKTTLFNEGSFYLDFYTSANAINEWGSKTWGNKVWGGKLETLELFTGKLTEVNYQELGVDMVLLDKMSYQVSKVVGSDATPIDMHSASGYGSVDYSNGINPADMFWSIVTNFGELDNTTSTANTDIDYTLWLDWKSRLSALNYKVKGEFKGETVQDILLKIAEYTNSIIYGEGNGKLICRHLLTASTSFGAADYDTGNVIGVPELKFNTDRIINRSICYYGYVPSTGNWGGSDMAEDSTSQTEYGLRDKTVQDTAVWHFDTGSASQYVAETKDFYKDPLEELQFTTGLTGYAHQLGDVIRMDFAFQDIKIETDKGFLIETLDFNIGTGLLTVNAIFSNLATSFILDDPVMGLLDQPYNPLL